MRSIFGVDPGISGGWWQLNFEKLKNGGSGRGIFKAGYSDFRAAVQLNDLVFVEHVGSFRRDSPMTAFRLGEEFGRIQGIVETIGAELRLIRPQVWQKWAHGTIAPGPIELPSCPKARSLLAARSLFPTESFLATARSRVPHQAIVDAACLAAYGAWVITSQDATTRDLRPLTPEPSSAGRPG